MDATDSVIIEYGCANPLAKEIFHARVQTGLIRVSNVYTRPHAIFLDYARRIQRVYARFLFFFNIVLMDLARSDQTACLQSDLFYNA